MLPLAAAALTHKSLAGLDIAVIAVYFLIIFAIGFYFARKKEHNRLFPRQPQRGMVRHRGLAICFQHFHRALHRTSRSGASSGLAVRTLLSGWLA